MKKNIFLIFFIVSILFISSLICLQKLSFFSFIHSKKDMIESLPESSENIHQLREILTEQDFEDLKQSSDQIVVKIYADWCGGCQYVNAFLPSLQDQFKKDVTFYALNADNTKIMDQLTKSNMVEEPIAYLPTFLLIKNGVIKKQIVGVKEFDQMASIIKTTFGL